MNSAIFIGRKPVWANYFFLLAILLLLNSCLSTKTIYNQVSEKVNSGSKSAELINTPYLILKADSLLNIKKQLDVNKKSHYFIPLGVYWGWKQENEISLPDSFLIVIFNKVLVKRDKEFQYQKFFNDKTLLIEIEQLPTRFFYTQKGTYWFFPTLTGLGIYYTSEDIYPEKQSLRVKYRFYNNNEVIKTGEIKVDMKNPESRIFNPASQNLIYYMDDYKKEFEKLCEQIIDKVVDDL